ncbi:FtsK/SpoIIIE family DNA translocase [Candidatus Nanosynbacter lyticus]|uniref:FtsK/SpoIIIE family DNA translocase n=1 Tax=Candidatus Nanosynbacter lyticus TaxID=2093824 RepID=UPI002553D842|nr:DNA translocase FtsK 4TM domain-containing protein [Candidatus Nanosynbacter lyticus]WLD46483.1 DNA translocase FtsK [Candidatus Nanosynbacter lyticus]
MPKKRKSTRKKSVSTAPKHDVPSGFWAQVGAVLLVVLSLLLMVAWFGVGGPVLEWLHKATLSMLGYAMYGLPILLIYIAVEIFRAENNRLPLAMKLAAILEVVWLSGLFGLLKTPTRPNAGGFIGDTANRAMSAMVDPGIAALIYVVLIIITALFITQTSPFMVIKKIAEALKRDHSEEDNNAAVMKKAAREDAASAKSSSDIKLNAGVPTVDPVTPKDKKASPLSSLRGSVARDKAAEEQAALVAAHDPNWQAPSLDLLEKKQSPADAGDIRQNAQIIHDTLAEFNIDVEMEDANIGPKVTQYTLRPPSGVKLTRITALETNIALNLAAQSLRIEAPIPGQKAVGIEVPNRRAADVRLYGVLDSKQWKNAREPLSFAIGKDISGEAVVGELNKMPHMLIAGQTGSGKSVMINTLLTSLLYRNSPSDMKLILVDPKQVEMAPYEDIPHLLTPVITEPEKTISALKWAVNEMERRYKLLAAEKIRDIKGYNQRLATRAKKIPVADADGNIQQHEDGAMPYIVIVIDELADLMMVAARDVEALIVRLAQKARAVGIHLVLATQRPSVDVITGLIKANVPARIGFTVASQVDSRTILDQIGAEKLLGQGDMLLYTPSMSKPKRIQGAWVTDDEVNKITDHLRMQSAPQYNDEVVAQPVQLNGKGGLAVDFSGGGEDEAFMDAVRVVIEGGKASTSYLQRRLRIGYGKAARLIEEMEERGIVGPANGSKARDVLVSSIDELGNS